MSALQADSKIRKASWSTLLKVWDEVLDLKASSWVKGIGFEHIICRAFELEGASVIYPYNVTVQKTLSEQIDGLIYFDNVYCLIECKNQQENVDFEPLSKLRARLQRRPSAAIGAIFTTSSFTEPALILSEYLHPQTILLWERDEIEECLKRKYFRAGLLIKYRNCIANGLSNYNLLADFRK